jgi:hypothetical protein
LISSDTPYKLADIIRDTWPQIYRPPAKKTKMTESDLLMNKLEDVAVAYCHQMIKEKLEKAEKLSQSYSKNIEEKVTICPTSLALLFLQYEDRINDLEERIKYLEYNND